MKSKFTIMAILLVGLVLPPAKRCFANSMDFMAQDFKISVSEEGGYRYDLGTSGGFVTNVRNNQTYKSAYFQFDDTISYDILREDGLIDYKNGSVLTEAGEYEVYVFSDESGVSSYGSLAFTIEGTVTKDDSTLKEDNFLNELSEIQVLDAIITYTYDPDTKFYRQWIKNTAVADTNIPKGMTTTEYVYADFDDSLIISCYRNGEIIDLPEDSIYREPGSYRIDLKLYSAEEGEQANIYTASFHFTIIDSITSLLGVVTPPEGFVIKSARYGSSVLEFAPEYVFLDGDGTYYIDFVSLKEPQATCSLTFEKDTTAPFLTFDKKVVSRNKVTAPVTFVSSEKDAKIQILRSGVEITVSDNTIQSGGSYQIIVKDQVGNTRNYSIFLENHYSLYDRRLVYALIAFMIAFVVWIIITRNRYRVL